MAFDIGLDLFPLLAAVLSAVACGLLGNFLVLRRMSLMGDAISHAVLPGLVIAFLISSTRSPLAMFIGAALAGLATVVLVEVVQRYGRVERGAAMGVVFSVLFALGVLLIERAAARHVDLDADCVLYGQLETLVWFEAPAGASALLNLETLRAMPRQVVMLLVVAALSGAFVVGLFKELRIASFDAGLATAQGMHAGLLHYLLMVLVACATVASFEAVGSILVIAMLICPAATARLMTDRLGAQVWWSMVFALAAAVGGYIGATMIPGWFGKDSVNAAGMIAVFSGGLFVFAVVGSPRHGLVARALRQRRFATEIARDDVLALLYRARETGAEYLKIERVDSALGAARVAPAVRGLVRDSIVDEGAEGIGLTERGVELAQRVVRRHRLWEHYLVDEAGIASDHVHDLAERLEHIDVSPERGPATDPHGRDIPE